MSSSPCHLARDTAALARAHHLVAPHALDALMAGGALLLLEVGCGGPEQFALAHVPGAAWFDIGRLEAPPLFNKVDDAVLLAELLSLGVHAARSVVLYGRNQLAAARAAHLMLYAGVRDVRLLDGGFGAWRAAGLPCASGDGASPVAAADFGAPFPGRADYLLDLRQARSLLARGDAALASIRTWSEHAGLTSGYSYIAARGDIPGARWGRAGREGDINSMSEYQMPDGRMRAAADIARMWQQAGIAPQLQIGFYCGTGWRASLAFFYAWLMGWERIAVFDGGWYEWSMDPANPVALADAEALSA